MHYKKQPTNKLKSGWVPWPKESRGEAEEIEAGRQAGRWAGQQWFLISDRIAHGQAGGRSSLARGRLAMPASVAANSAAEGSRGGATAGEVRYAIKIFSWSNKAARARDSERAREREGAQRERN